MKQSRPETRPTRRGGRWKRRLGLAAAAVLLSVGALLVAGEIVSGRLPSGDEIRTMKNSPNYVDGKFVNGIPAEDPPILKTLTEWIKGGENTFPREPIPTVRLNRRSFDTAPEGGLRITWLGHSTSLIEISGLRLLLDPVWSERCSPFSWTGPKRFYPPPLPFEALPKIDAVLISHDHYDHLDKATVLKLAGTVNRFIVPLGVGARLRGWGVSSDAVEELDWWQETTVDAVRVTATPARHFSGRSPVMSDRNKTLWAGFAISAGERRVYYTGDTGMFPGFREIGERLGPFDAVLVEIGAYHRLWADLHLGPEQAATAAKEAGAALMIPVHWGTFDLALHSWVEPVERLLAAVRDGSLAVAIPKPGQSVDPAAPPKIERYWPNLPWQTATEHPIVSSGL